MRGSSRSSVNEISHAEEGTAAAKDPIEAVTEATA